MAQHHAYELYRERAARLINSLAVGCYSEDGQGYFTPAAYDTAWLAMVSKNTDLGKVWLFPQCFEYIINSQRSDGHWGSCSSQVDGILNTAAALLALHHHKSDVDRYGHLQVGLEASIANAEAALHGFLESWDVSSTLHVGFEILVPKLLQLLEEFGFTPVFPGRTLLTNMNTEKMSKFKPQMLYTERQTTILHSLEALIGHIDFDQVRRHVNQSRGIFGSPASTAAYLMHSSEWDSEAEEYLWRVVRRYDSSGRIPSAFPTPVFEISWTVCALDSYNLQSAGRQQSQAVSVVKGYLSTILKNQDGLAGFSGGILPDADDTAKCIAALQCLGETVDLDPMVKAFEAKTHFKTYDLERNPSLSANCNVLSALTGSPQAQRFVPQVEKALRFLLDTWDKGSITDKWNLSPAYSHMSIGCALVALLGKVDQGGLQGLDKTLVAERVPVALCQLLSHTVSEQFESNVWIRSCLEVSAYNVILLGRLLSLPWPDHVREMALDAFHAGREYIVANEALWSSPNYLWIEKVTYGSPVLSEAYCLAAAGSDCALATWSDHMRKTFSINSTKSQGMVKLVSSVPLFHNITHDMLHLAQLEASYFARHLARVRLQVFPDRDATMSKDKYLSFIPLAWTSCQLLRHRALSNNVLWDMMVISLLNYQVDEYMESVVSKLSNSGTRTLLRGLRSVCGLDVNTTIYDGSEGEKNVDSGTVATAEHLPPSPPGDDMYLNDRQIQGNAQKAYDTLTKFVSYVLQHEAVISSPASVRSRLKEEVFAFLQAHIDHNEANKALKSGPIDIHSNEQHRIQPPPNAARIFHKSELPSYFEWVRLTGANDTSCPYSFTFFCCLLSEPDSHCLSTASQLYYGQSLCRSLATMCRQYNDYGSWLRDQQECNLNSLHFSEFVDDLSDHVQDEHSTSEEKPLSKGYEGQSAGATTQLASRPSDGARRCLMELAEFERSCVNLAFDRLKAKVSQKTADAIATFVNVTDFFGQMYVAKDLASRVK